MHRLFAVTLAASVALLVACEQKDTTPPPAPVVDPISSPTPLTKIWVTGSAEFGAAISISGGAAPVETTSDPFTARWGAWVELQADAENTLSVVATDAAGNASAATTAKVVQSPSKPASIRLSFTSPAARAGELVGLATYVLDQYGHEMPDAAVTFESTPALAATFTIPGSAPAVTKNQGVLAGTRQFVAYDLSGVDDAGYEFQIKATAGSVSDTQVLGVRPAAAMSFSKLAFVPSGTTLDLQAGQDAEYAYEVVDLYGNVTTGPVSAYSSAPGAIVVDDGVSGSGKVARLTSAGTYSLSFYIAGVGQKGSMTINVGTAPGAVVEVSASTTLTSPQSTVQVFARVRDQFGNLIACKAGAGGNTGDIAFAAVGALATSVAPAPGATDCFNGAFRATFVFTTEDTWAITATWHPSGATAVASSVFVTVLAFDNTPPTVVIQNINVVANNNGTSTSCTPAAGCDAAGGDTISFDVVAHDNLALAQAAYSVFFETANQLSTRTVFVPANVADYTVSFRFRVPNTADSVPLVATAVDRAGNLQNSSAVMIRVGTGVPFGNRTITVVTGGNRVDQPMDVSASGNGDVFVVNGNNSNLVRVPAGSNVQQILATGVNGDSILVASVGGTEKIFATDSNNNRLYSFDTSGANRATLATAAPYFGLSALGAMPARGWFDLNAAADQSTATLTQDATTEAYEIDTNASCTATATKACVASTASASAMATALAAAINANASSLVKAAAAGSKVLLEAKRLGEQTAASNTVNLTAGGNITRSMPTLVEGHDLELYVGNDGDSTLRRYLTSGTAHGTFGLNNRQLGVAVRDVWSAVSGNERLFDVLAYHVDGGSNLLASALSASATSPGTLANSVQQAFSIGATTVAPTVGFSQLADVVVAPSGCLLVSDAGNGNVYVVDTRAAKTFTGLVVDRVARGIPRPRGLGLVSNGGAGSNAQDLLVAAENANAILRITPTADTTDCF